MKKEFKTRWQCSKPGCTRGVPYTDWTTCEEHNPYRRLFESSPPSSEEKTK